MPLWSIEGRRMKSIPDSRREFYEKLSTKAPDASASLYLAITEKVQVEERINASHLGSNMLKGAQAVEVRAFEKAGILSAHVGMFFGILVWRAMVESETDWMFVKTPSDPDPEASLQTVYWRGKP